MTPMERLAFLADALENDAQDPKGLKFNLSTWLHFEKGGDINKKPEDYSRNCGTHGCAIGLAMVLPELQAEGLKMSYMSRLAGQAPFYDGMMGFAAVQSFFNLTEGQADHLFHPACYDEWRGRYAELEVARRIRTFIAGQHS